MTTDRHSPAVRRLARVAAMAPAVLVSLVTAPAMAAAPETWNPADPVSGAQFLLVIVVLPLGLFAIIAVLAYVPSMVRGEKYTPGLAWRKESEWFGGPAGGVESVDRKPEIESGEGGGQARGGASGRW